MAKKKSKYKEEDKLQMVCEVPPTSDRMLSSGIDPLRESFIRRIEKTWVNGTLIKFCFFDHNQDHGSPSSWTGNEADRNVVRKAFEKWKKVGIGLLFEEIDDPLEAHVRIGFMAGNGSWSYLGTDVLGISKDKRTINFGWDLDGSWYGEETALHEIGHTLGAPHEHQNPNAGIDWDEDEVYDYFQGPPNNWPRSKIDSNILNKIAPRDVEGSNWDPDSIMHYQFQPDLIDGPSPYDRKGIFPKPGLSKNDKEWVTKFYPLQSDVDYIELSPFTSQRAVLNPGDQLDYIIRPDVSRKYKMQTFGDVDTLLVLFENDDSEPIYLAGDDDSGQNFNASIEHRLIKGRSYILRLRFYFSSTGGETAVMLW